MLLILNKLNIAKIKSFNNIAIRLGIVKNKIPDFLEKSGI